ncbi:unnamed protein product, partial [Effrenium voratum]
SAFDRDIVDAACKRIDATCKKQTGPEQRLGRSCYGMLELLRRLQVVQPKLLAAELEAAGCSS